MPAPPTKSPLRIGEVFLGEYQILDAIGRGGYGCVYRAREEFTGREVALKIIPIDDSGSRVARDTFDRGRQEAKILAEIEHPHIVKVYRAGQTPEGHIYIVMELLRGVSLAQRLREGPIEVEEGLRIIEALADALRLVHSKNIAHRDIKPGNIILREDGVAKLVDFGIAKVAGGGGALTAPNQVPGTGLYISPEQLYSVISKGPRPPFELGDIYALGLVAFQMFQGTHPFLMLDPGANFANPQVVWKFHMETPVPRLDQVIEGFPGAVALLVATALAKDPDDRLKSMAEFGAKARTARINFLGRRSAAHFTPLTEETPRDRSTSADQLAAPATAAIVPRSTKKQFQTDAPTQYVDIPEATLERHSPLPERPAESNRPRPASSRPQSADFSNPRTPQAASRTITLPRGMKPPRKPWPIAWTLSAGVLAGLALVFGLLPLARGMLTNHQGQRDLAPGDVVVESVEPLPERARPLNPPSPTEDPPAELPKEEETSENTEAPPDEPPAPPPAQAAPAPKASAPAPKAPAARTTASATSPKRAPFKVHSSGEPAPKPKAKDWQADLSGDGWLD